MLSYSKKIIEADIRLLEIQIHRDRGGAGRGQRGGEQPLEVAWGSGAERDAIQYPRRESPVRAENKRKHV